jgi:hypothetical protein
MAIDSSSTILLNGFAFGFVGLGKLLLTPIALVILNALCAYLITSAVLLGRYKIKDFRKFSKTFLGPREILQTLGEGEVPPALGWGLGLGIPEFILILMMANLDSGSASPSLMECAYEAGVWVAGLALGVALLAFLVCAAIKMGIGLDRMVDRYTEEKHDQSRDRHQAWQE